MDSAGSAVAALVGVAIAALLAFQGLVRGEMRLHVDGRPDLDPSVVRGAAARTFGALALVAGGLIFYDVTIGVGCVLGVAVLALLAGR